MSYLNHNTANAAAQVHGAAVRLDKLVGWVDAKLSDEHADRQLILEDLCTDLADLAEILRRVVDNVRKADQGNSTVVVSGDNSSNVVIGHISSQVRRSQF